MLIVRLLMPIEVESSPKAMEMLGATNISFVEKRKVYAHEIAMHAHFIVDILSYVWAAMVKPLLFNTQNLLKRFTPTVRN